MKILTDNLKPYSSLFGAMRPKGIARFEYVYLDLREGFLFFQTADFTSMRIRLKLDEYEDHDPMFVHGMKFFTMVNQSEYVNLQGKVFTTDKGTRFILPELDEDFQVPSFDVDDTWKKINFKMDKIFLKNLKAALTYVGDTPAEGGGGVYFLKDRMVALRRDRFFNVDASRYDATGLVLPSAFAKLMTQVQLRKIGTGAELEDSDLLNVSVYLKAFGEGKRINFEMDDLAVVFPTDEFSKFPIPDLDDPEVKAAYYSDLFVEVDRAELIEALKTINGFVEDLVIKEISVKFDLESNMVELSTFKSGELVCKIPVLQTNLDADSSELFKFWIFFEELNLASSTIFRLPAKSQNIVIRYQESQPMVLFSPGDDDQDIGFSAHATILMED